MNIIYIVLLVSCLISTFSVLSNGSVFTETIKGIITLIHYLIVIVLAVVSIFVGGAWYYVLLIPAISLVASWIISFILSITIFKDLNIGRRR